MLSVTRGLVGLATLKKESKNSYAELNKRIGCLRWCRHGSSQVRQGEKWEVGTHSNGKWGGMELDYRKTSRAFFLLVLL